MSNHNSNPQSSIDVAISKAKSNLERFAYELIHSKKTGKKIQNAKRVIQCYYFNSRQKTIWNERKLNFFLYRESSKIVPIDKIELILVPLPLQLASNRYNNLEEFVDFVNRFINEQRKVIRAYNKRLGFVSVVAAVYGHELGEIDRFFDKSEAENNNIYKCFKFGLLPR